MSVASQNLFAYLADEGDDSPAPLPAPKGPAPAPVAAPKPATAAPAGGAASKTSAPRGGQRGDYPGRGGPRKVYQGDREINPDGTAPIENGKETRGAHFEGSQRGRGRGGGQGRGRGGRGTSNPRSNSGTYAGGDRPRREKGGPRALDKHSQTGHKESEKQIDQGWGANEGEKELQAEVEGEEDAKKEAAPASEGVETPAPKTPAAEPEEEDNTQTYDEYLAAQAAKKLSISLPEARSANEGADESQWKSGVALLKKGEVEEESWGGLKKAEKARVRKEKEAKTFIEVDFVSKPPRREPREGGRGGRGGPRGGRGGGRGRGGAGSENRAPRSSQQAVNIDDASAFPSLA